MSYTPPVGAATTTTQGVIKLAGDLAGTGALPSVVKINGVSVNGTPSIGQVPVASNGTTASWAAVDDQTAVKKAGSTMTGKLIVPTFQVTGGSPGVDKVLTSDASGNATWQTAASSSLNVVSKSIAYTAVVGDYVLADATSPITITLPTAASAGSGSIISVKKIDSSGNPVTISVSGGGVIDNSITDSLSSQWLSHDYLSNGTQWYLV